MKMLRVWYTLKADVEFTWTEVQSLNLLSEMHYDGECQNMFVGAGFNPKTSTIAPTLDSIQLDYLAKIAEHDPILHQRLITIVAALREDYYKINAENLQQ